MGFLTNLKARRAYQLHVKGDVKGAMAVYGQAYAEGLSDPKLLIAYGMLLLRAGDYERTVEVLRKADKLPGVAPDQKTQIVQHYAVAIWKLGQHDRALEWLWQLFRKQKTGALYGVLGFLLVEKAAEMKSGGDPTVTAADIQAAKDEAVAFNREAVDYDEDDAICLDNLGQAYYRLLGDKGMARTYFERALKRRPNAIDTNYFLAQYDLEQGNAADAADKLEISAAGRFSPLNYTTREMVEAQLSELKLSGLKEKM